MFVGYIVFELSSTEVKVVIKDALTDKEEER
jgi:hypothetical protein